MVDDEWLAMVARGEAHPHTQAVQVAIMASIMLIVMRGLPVTLFLQHPCSGGVGIAPEAFRELAGPIFKLSSTPNEA